MNNGGVTGGDPSKSTGIQAYPRRGARHYGAATSLPEPLSIEEESQSFITSVHELLRVVRKRKGSLIVCACLGAIIGLLVSLPKTPVYRARVSIEIQPQNDDFFYSKDVNPNMSTSAMYPDIDMATQVRVLQTKALQNRVIAKLQNDESLRITPPEDRLAAWRQLVHLPAVPVPDRASMLADAGGSVVVTAQRTARIIDVQCDSTDPKLAAAYANAVAAAYQEETLETRWQSAQHTGEWLTRQLDEMKVKLQKSEEDLQSYAASMNLVLTGDKDKANIAEEKLRQLQAQVSDAQADLAVKQAKYDLTKNTKPDSLGQVLDDPALRSLDAKLADLRREKADLLSTLTPAHYKVKKVVSQITQMEADRNKARDLIVERTQNDWEESAQREKLVAATYAAQARVVAEQAGKSIHYNILEREADTNRQMYESLLQRVKEAGVSSAMRASNISVIDAAEPTSAPVSPNLPMSLLIGLATGLCSGFGLVMFQEKSNRFLEAPGDTAYLLNTPELGVIPSASLDRQAILGGENKNLRLADFGAGAALVPSGKTGPSMIAEAFRVLLTSILFIGKRRPAQVIVVTSPGAGEGKTTILSNLALAYAETGRSVLLIDADMRRPRLHEVFGIGNEEGLARLLSHPEPLEPRSLFLATHRFNATPVSVLPSGTAQVSTANLLHSKRLPELIALAREQFDIVLIDTPPMLHLADSRVVGSLADGVILVARSGQTTRESALLSRKQLMDDGVPVLGVALNDWNPKMSGYYSTYDYVKYYEGRG